MENIKVFKIDNTLNGKVNIEKLSLELKTSVIKESSTELKFGGEIQIRYQNEIDEDDLLILTSIIENHDGADAQAYHDEAVSARENKIRELNQLAMFHPLLDNIQTVRFLTFIDNYINGFVRSGIHDVVVEKIAMEAQNTDGDYYDYLNLTVNTKGNKTYEYFIGAIMA